MIRQAHHLRETGWDVVDLQDHTLRGHDVDIAHDLHRSVVDPSEAPAYAPIGWQGEGTALHFHAANEHAYLRRLVRHIRKAQLGVHAYIVVPGQPVGGAYLARR